MNAPFPSAENGPPAGTNSPEYTVSELSRSIKRTVEDEFGFVRVRGEIGGFRGRHGSGHAYFSLKDANACLDAVVWRGTWSRLSQPPEEGLEVIATGRLTTFAKKSSYQLVVEQLEPAGLGALMKLLEERRKALAAEGLFDEARKRPLPALPRTIGVITSPTGAVIRDILHRVADRFASHVVVWPVRVQGETSGREVAAAVEGFARYPGPRPDVIIIARGGGSVEDLWGYNDEALVRAVAASPIPIVSAVGHETDWTLVDHAADHRAPTPTGAAERVVPVRADCLATLGDRARRLEIAIASSAQRRGDRLRLLARALPGAATLLSVPRQRLDVASDRLSGALGRSTALARQRFTATAARLSPQTARHPVERAGERLQTLSARLQRAHVAQDTARSADLARLSARLSPLPLARRIEADRQTLARLVGQRDRAMGAALATSRQRLGGAAKLLAAVSYQAVLSRGFALVRREGEGEAPVRRAGDIAAGERLSLEFADGRADVVEASACGPVKPARTAAAAAPREAKRGKLKKPDERQGVLF